MTYYPLKFRPIFKERLWGGTKLKDVLSKESQGDAVGESWELSGVEGDISEVANGTLSGTLLTALIEQDPKGLLGASVVERFGMDFPILIKFIDAQKDLSIQLHPNDRLAKERHNSFGKTEMWYIMDAEPDSQLIVGFNRTINKETYAQSLKENTLLELLNYEPVREGDTFFINTGKVHAIGAGVLLAEIQQTSDITYRIFDFNRKDKDGNQRELHTELALDAIDYLKKDDFRVRYAKEPDEVQKMVRCPYFNTNYMDLTQNLEQKLSDRDSFTIYVCVGGSGTLGNEFGEVPIQRGETVLIAASCNVLSLKTSGLKLLEVTL